MSECDPDIFIKEHVPCEDQTVEQPDLSLYGQRTPEHFLFKIRRDLNVRSDERTDETDARQSISGQRRI